MAMTLDVAATTLRLAEPFRISGYVFESWDVVSVTLRDGEHGGRGEGGGAYYLGDDVANMLAQIEAARSVIEGGPTREELRAAMPAGGGRNAVDCALWDLEAARAGTSAWRLAGLPEARPVRTTFTIGADTPEAMAGKARGYTHARSIKVKLTGDLALDIARVEAIRGARPDVWMGVDGNQGFVAADLPKLTQALQRSNVSLLEQPLRRGDEAALEGFTSPVPIAGDESLLTLADIPGAVGRFDVVNIKLDKCGGLTEGLLMAAEARARGLGVMVGCMVGTSIAMAPAVVLGQYCDLVDLDGPTFLSQDVSPAVTYADGMISASDDVWGTGMARTA
jgi:L-alanine-DL-glutamate epimerase-like enolase superfamily enzyme